MDRQELIRRIVIELKREGITTVALGGHVNLVRDEWFERVAERIVQSLPVEVT